jgi:hypothetical protein
MDATSALASLRTERVHHHRYIRVSVMKVDHRVVNHCDFGGKFNFYGDRRSQRLVTPCKLAA